MGRRRRTATEHEADKTRVSVPVIEPNGVYRLKEMARALRVGVHTIQELVRTGELRTVLKAGKRYALGAWLLDWFARPTEQPTSGQEPQRDDAEVSGM